MTKAEKLGFAFLLGILFTILLVFQYPEGIARAADLPTYNFKISAQKITDGSEYELKTASTYVSVVADGWAAPSTVVWTSSETGVVNLENTSDASTVKMVRNGPGYSTITAKITQDGYSYTISFVVKVNLEINYQATGTTYSTTTSQRVLILDTVGQNKTVYMKFVDYTPDGGTSAVSGAAIAATAVTFDSDNKGVATVDANGRITAVGGGSATITITSATMSSKDSPMTVELNVVVAPSYSFTYDDSSGVTHNCYSKDDNTDPAAVYSGVPSNFVIQSNATLGENLKWVIYNVTGSTKTLVTSGTKLTYTINASGTVTFSNIKAGTYEIYALAGDSYSEKSNVPYAYMKIYVPISLSDLSIVMNVGDTYSILDNSNIPSTSTFVAPSGYDTNVAKLDTSNYVITAKRAGTVKIHLVYNTGQKLFEGTTVDDMYLTVTVVDGIALSTTNATLYTKGTLQLEAVVSDTTDAITWSSSNTSIATVVDGLVTGVKAGTCTITVSQKVNGVVKKATCDITVQQSVSSITLTPSTITLPIGSFATLHAQTTPSNLSGVTLKWTSSDESVVKIVESSALTVTIQGVSGGHAVICAINQDNVVVGYCHVSVQQSVTSIVLSETSAILNLTDKNLQLRATCYPDNALNKTVIWSSTDTSKATVDANGLVTLLKPGTVTIIATSADSPAIVAYCNLTIQIPVVSIALDETTKTMYVGQSERLTYVILPTNASNNAVTWTSTNSSVVTVDATGKVTAKGVGTAVVILRTSDGGFSVYCTITVKLVATTIKLDAASLTLRAGEYYYLKATLSPKGSTENDLEWESSDTKIATVDENGKITAKNAGTAVIMVRTEAGGVAYCKLTVTQPVSGITLNYTEKTIVIGTKFDLTVSVSPSTATKLDVTWKSSNKNVATVTAKGEVAGIKGGVAIITCTTTDGGYIATCVVTVREPVTSIKLNHSSYSIGVKKTVKLTAKVTTDSATNTKLKWSSSNSKVATVNSSGKVTGIKVGTATITVKALDGSDVEASCTIKVVHPVSSIKINHTTLTLYVGSSRKLKVTIKPKNSTYKSAKWSSSKKSVAIVSSDGTVIAVKAGNATITAAAKDNSGKKTICYVTVLDRVASTGVTLQDKTVTMVPGESKTVNAVVTPTNSTDSLKWSSDNSAVASVNRKTGKITAKSTGTATITVMTSSGKTATVEVTVVGLNISKLVTEEYTTYTSALSVEGATATVTWRSDNPLVAVVYSDGTVSTRGAGTCTITATVNGRRLYCKVIVKSM